MNNWKVGDKARYKNSFDVQITHVSKYCFIGKAGNEGESYGLLDDLTPIKSSEQIEREKAIDDLNNLIYEAQILGVTEYIANNVANFLVHNKYHNQPKVKEINIAEFVKIRLASATVEVQLRLLVSEGYIIEKKEQDNDWTSRRT